MYIPKYYKETNMEEIKEFIQGNSFGTVVSTEKGKPIATHLPLELHKEDNKYYITGHMAYGNPQWRTFENEDDSILVMYQGPDAYISSSWYKHENVPTWNYQAVHVYGSASLMTQQELEEDLILLLQKYENHRQNPVLWENLSPQAKKQIKGIVGFKIEVKEVQAAYKLSQNRNEEDYNRIVENLRDEQQKSSIPMANLMEKRRNSN
ncbi:FMN-binding negative transcriptional regulator [Rummeliibacillus stabekisii]|uniref:Protease n=1 Tax=Rummeliibacillus stabekisii TaxID=241244 RepID=A0A143HEY5_9BACL|nr:FMN-binding negative transcriptional regulator [Rummeliibacillus stabekisii]AMX00293.1 protease [Rummeliibacillus stabekisii]